MGPVKESPVKEQLKRVEFSTIIKPKRVDYSSIEKPHGPKCVILDCKSRVLTSPNLSFFNIPKDNGSKKRQCWIDAIRKSRGPVWEPKAGNKVCSLHFKSGNHSHTQKEDDFAPNLHLMPA